MRKAFNLLSLRQSPDEALTIVTQQSTYKEGFERFFLFHFSPLNSFLRFYLTLEKQIATSQERELDMGKK